MTKPNSTQLQFFNDDGVEIFAILKDGTIVTGEAFTTREEASLEFWEGLQNIVLKTRELRRKKK